MQYPEFDLEKLKKEQEQYASDKGMLDLAGAIGQNFADQPTAYEVLYNKKLGGPNVKGVTDAVSKGMVDPLTKADQQMKGYAWQKQVSEDSELNQKDSTRAQAAKMMGIKKGFFTPEDAKDMTLKDVYTFFDPKKIREIEAQSQIDFNNQKQLRQMDQTFKEKESALNRANDLEKIDLKNQLSRNNEDKNLPQNVTAAATFAKRVEDSNKQMENLISGGYDPTGFGPSLQDANLPIPFVDIPLVPERFKTDNKKLMDQAQRNFINATLRRESGSAINEGEFANAKIQYFPQPGDSDKVLEQKKRNREVVLAGLKTEGAKALPRLENNLDSSMGAVPGKNINSAGAKTTKPQPHAQDADALTWAMNNPKDPRAKTILSSLGVLK